MLSGIKIALALLTVYSILATETIEAKSHRHKKKPHALRGSSSDSDSDETVKESSEESDTQSSPSSSSEDEEEELDYGTKGKPKRRVCHPCPEDKAMKWRDPRILWICGSYQRARRSFKSLCMMHYRNCQDGTMFVKINDHRCKNHSYHGDHFFYDYKEAP